MFGTGSSHAHVYYYYYGCKGIYQCVKLQQQQIPHLRCNHGAFQHRGDLSNGVRVVKARDVVPRDHTVRAGKVVFRSTLDVLGKTVETLLVVQFGQLGSISDVSRYAIRGEIAKRSTTTAFSSVEFTVREREGRGEGERESNKNGMHPPKST